MKICILDLWMERMYILGLKPEGTVFVAQSTHGSPEYSLSMSEVDRWISPLNTTSRGILSQSAHNFPLHPHFSVLVQPASKVKTVKASSDTPYPPVSPSHDYLTSISTIKISINKGGQMPNSPKMAVQGIFLSITGAANFANTDFESYDSSSEPLPFN